jgi:hypothetical protein
MHTEAYSFDELAEQLRYTHQLREDYGIDIVSAMQTDVPGATVGLSTLLTDAGVRYFSVAHNYAGRSIPHMVDGQDLKRPFYWEAPDGDRVLVWYTDTLHGIAYMEAMTLGFGTGYEDVLGSLPEYLNALSERPYPYGDAADWVAGSLEGIPLTKTPYPYDILNLRVQAAFADNASTSLVPSDIVREWNTRWAYPRLRMSLNRDFFSEAEANIGDQLETYRGDWTDWWADGIGSGAVPLAKNRQAQSDIRTAQTLNAIADGLTDNPRPELAQYFQAAYEDMALFDEHTWGAANPWEQGASGMSSGEYQWTRKSAFAYSAEEKVRTLLEGAIQRIAPLAATPRQELDGTGLLVFNPSAFARTDLVKIFLPERQLDTVPVELIDLTTGGTIPFVIEPQTNSKHRLRGQYIRFLARDIPPIGYARYAVTSGRGKNPHNLSSIHTHGEPTPLATEMLNADIDVSTATVRSMKDVQSDIELIADSAPYGFNAYIFDRYASAPRFNHLSSRIGNAGPWLLGSRGGGHFGHVVERESNSVWERITLRYEGDGADWLESTLTLPHGVARLHISNRLHKPSILEKESVYFAFPFAMDDPNITFQITGGTASNDSPHVPGSANHFRAIRHWATLTAPNAQPVAWATTDAPLVQMGNIYLPYAPFPKTIDEQDSHRSTIYSWALNNIWDTNFPPRQGGEMQFRYTIATNADGDPRALGADTGESAATPLVGVVGPMGAAGDHNVPDRSSFVDVPNPSVKVSHLMASRNGEGLTIILESEATEQTETTVTLQHLPIVGAKVGTFWETDLVETALEGNTVSLSIDPGELKSVVLRFR